MNRQRDSLSIGPVAQWIRHLTADQEIPGSNPGGVNPFLKLMASLSPLPLNKRNVHKTKYVSVEMRNEGGTQKIMIA